jgi:small-conductance mechanosensitive channel
MQRFAGAVAGVALIYIVALFLRRAATRQFESPDNRYKARKVISVFGYAATLVLLLSLFSGSLGQVTVALGVAGAGVAFALQEVIASFAGWVAISFGNFYKTGDRVQLGGIKGDVIDIGMFRTTLMEVGGWVKADLYNGRIVRVANSHVFKEPVFNYSADFPFLWDEITIGVKYGSEYALVRKILGDIGEELVGDYARGAAAEWHAMVLKYRLEDAKVEPTVTTVATESWLEFTLRYVVDYRLRRGTKDRIFTRFLEEIDKVPGRVNIAASSIEIAKLPPVNVHVESSGKGDR